jgi:hypothetical protein
LQAKTFLTNLGLTREDASSYIARSTARDADRRRWAPSLHADRARKKKPWMVRALSSTGSALGFIKKPG